MMLYEKYWKEILKVTLDWKGGGQPVLNLKKSFAGCAVQTWAVPDPTEVKALETLGFCCNTVPFKPVKILVKLCPNSSCQAMHQEFPAVMGM